MKNTLKTTEISCATALNFKMSSIYIYILIFKGNKMVLLFYFVVLAFFLLMFYFIIKKK
jgi:hypothetical protein